MPYRLLLRHLPRRNRHLLAMSPEPKRVKNVRRKKIVVDPRNNKSLIGFPSCVAKVGFLASLLCGVATYGLAPVYAQEYSPNTQIFSPSTTIYSSDVVGDNDAGPVSVIMNGSGAQILIGTNTYTGSTSVKNGTLGLGEAGSIADSSIVDVSQGAIFDISQTNSGASVKDMGGAGGIDLGSQTLTLT
ncbi:hypothetical protein K6L44_17405, partial [Gluconacetobacter entanii]|nr:hypothetical protein [Gluconacetobacter entanii]